jgi:hypothetical protein
LSRMVEPCFCASRLVDLVLLARGAAKVCARCRHRGLGARHQHSCPPSLVYVLSPPQRLSGCHMPHTCLRLSKQKGKLPLNCDLKVE